MKRETKQLLLDLIGAELDSDPESRHLNEYRACASDTDMESAYSADLVAALDEVARIEVSNVE